MSTQRTSDNVAEKVVKKSSLRVRQEEINPCYKEQLLTLKCLDSNQDHRDFCEAYFTNYNNCKKFWLNVQLERRLKGIKPYLPPMEERAQIKADYLKNK